MASVPSSSLVYLRKSFLRTRIRMVARKPVSSSTVTHEFMMLNQWICNQYASFMDAVSTLAGSYPRFEQTC